MNLKEFKNLKLGDKTYNAKGEMVLILDPYEDSTGYLLAYHEARVTRIFGPSQLHLEKPKKKVCKSITGYIPIIRLESILAEEDEDFQCDLAFSFKKIMSEDVEITITYETEE